MADEKKINTENRKNRFIYSESDVKSIFRYGPDKKILQKIQKK